MSNYDQKIQPVREQRIGLADSFAGHTCDLLKCSNEGCLLQKNRSFWQAGSCQMSLSLMMAATVKNSVLVVHSPTGCGHMLFQIHVQSNKGRVQRGQAPGTANWISTELNEADVIGGGERKLRDAIEYADREFRPEIIFVVSTCAPSIIGDDIAEVVSQAQKTVSAKIATIHCPGFKSRVVASAYDAFYHSLLKAVSFEPEPWTDYVPLLPSDPRYDMERAKEHYQNAHTVNVWNATSIGFQCEDEIKRLLNAVGLNVRIFAEYSGLDEMRQVSQAALNVSLCNVHDDYILKFLEEKFGTPYYIAGMPIGLRQTREWLLGIAKYFSIEKEVSRLCDYEESVTKPVIEQYAPLIKGKRTLIYGGVVRAGVEAVALSELGLDIIGLKAYHYDDNAKPIYEDVNKKLREVPLSVSNQAFEFAHQIRTLKPDLVVAHNGTHGQIAKLGFPSVQLFSADSAFFGYTGFVQILRKIEFVLSNTSYQKRLSKRVKQPYKDWYWEADTFTFLKN